HYRDREGLGPGHLRHLAPHLLPECQGILAWHHQRSGYSLIEWIIGLSFLLSTRRQVARRIAEVPWDTVNPGGCRGSHPANDPAARVGNDQDDRRCVLFGFGSKLLVAWVGRQSGFLTGFFNASGHRSFDGLVGGFFRLLSFLLPGL